LKLQFNFGLPVDVFEKGHGTMRRSLDAVTLALVIIGALNWGLVGLFKFDLVAAIVGKDFGEVNPLSRIIYILVALSGLYQIACLTRLLGGADESTHETSQVTMRG
jgi:uncharacterized membrane protein YuzA (DUF378 family)